MLEDKWVAWEDRSAACANLRMLMTEVSRERAYYALIPPGEGADREFTQRKSVDPDGRERDLLAEREQYLADLAPELDTLRAWTKQSKLKPVIRLLDVGCGYGRLLSAFSPLTGTPGVACFGIEPSEHSAGYAREHATVHVGTIENAPPDWECFDVVVLYHVIEHARDPVAMLRFAFERMSAGGRLLVGTPDFDGPIAQRYQERFRLLHDPTHIALFSTESLLRCLRGVGFEVERIDYPFPARYDTPEARAAAEAAGVSPPARGNVVTMYARKPA
jgi:SAM-dependent methyltransferase